MSNTMAIRVSPRFQSLKPRNPSLYFSHSYNGFLSILRNLSTPETITNSLLRTSLVCQNEIRGRIGKASTWSVNESVEDLNAPVSIDLEQIVNEGQFDRIVGEAQQLEVPVVIVWMASWCRKCIYLKPKLEKLAADYHPRIRFYCIDVNTVPHRLVSRAGVTKMPTIQVWKDCKKQAEVIGGHKAHLVVNEVREMIENEGAL